MNIDIIENNKNPLLKREELKLLVYEEKTPSIEQAIKIISDREKKSEEHIIIKKIESKFGRKSFLITSFVYDTVEAKDAVEKQKKKKETVKQ